MSVPANTVQTDDVSASNREDIVEAIYNIDPWETPFLSMAQRVKATATNHEWVTDTLSAAATNIQIEGDDATAIATTTPAKLNNYTQISDKVVSVSRTQRSIDSVGRADELAYQISKEGKFSSSIWNMLWFVSRHPLLVVRLLHALLLVLSAGWRQTAHYRRETPQEPLRATLALPLQLLPMEPKRH